MAKISFQAYKSKLSDSQILKKSLKKAKKDGLILKKYLRKF